MNNGIMSQQGAQMLAERAAMAASNEGAFIRSASTSTLLAELRERTKRLRLEIHSKQTELQAIEDALKPDGEKGT